MKWTPETGERFGRLMVVDTTLRAESQRPGWVGPRRFQCQCDCGTSIIVDPSALKNDYSRSCGCLRREAGVARGAASRQHGMWRHPLYKTWSSMVARCHNREQPRYADYGGRGIVVFEPWRSSPEAFLTWVQEHLGDKPAGHSLDRIDNDGNYEPGNLRWADFIMQNNNRRPRKAVSR